MSNLESLQSNSKNTSQNNSSIINNQVFSILKEDFDEYDKLIEILELLIDEPKEFNEQGWGVFNLKFSNNEYIRLILNWQELSIDMIDRPWNGIDAMLRIFLFALKNDVSKITWKAQPQKNKDSSKYERRRKILLNFYSSFWFKILNTSTWKMRLDLDDENIKILLNKVRYYIENKKWFSL